LIQLRLLIRDRDRAFKRSFDDVLSTGIRIVRAPIQAPEANAVANDSFSTGRSWCLDWLPILSAGHLERVLTVFIDRYTRHKAHRSLNLNLPNGPPANDARAHAHKLIVSQLRVCAS
jgi:hypothetical protein